MQQPISVGTVRLIGVNLCNGLLALAAVVMKYGKQLLVGLYQPWQSKYVRYAKLKRLITRFELEIGLEGKRSRVNSTLDLVAKGSTTPRNTTPPPSQHAINVASPRAAADALRVLTDEKTTLLSVNNQGGGMLTPTHRGVVMYGDPQESRKQQFFEVSDEAGPGDEQRVGVVC